MSVYILKKAADVSGDGFINSSDYILMRSKILKIIPKFPVERG
ncbi:dockerin type I domain-containing protein [Pseudobacteroides cellulosolvens]|nr:dockerin type I domain-containing protein [Pseudobacteroides cellulosolvens]